MCIISISAALGTSLATALGVSVTAGTVAGTAVAGATVAGATIAGGVLGTVSSVQQAEAQKRQAEFLAQQAEENARLSNRRAENIELQANQKRAALLMESQQRRGAARAGFAANGVVLGSGVTADYEADIANAYDLDLKNYNYDVASQAWQAKVQGVNEANSAALYRAQAEMYGQQKTSSLLGGLIGTAGSALGGMFSMATGLAKFSGGASGSASGGFSADAAVNYRRNTRTMLA